MSSHSGSAAIMELTRRFQQQHVGLVKGVTDAMKAATDVTGPIEPILDECPQTIVAIPSHAQTLALHNAWKALEDAVDATAAALKARLREETIGLWNTNHRHPANEALHNRYDDHTGERDAVYGGFVGHGARGNGGIA